MRAEGIVVIGPSLQLPHHRLGTGPVRQLGVVSLERLDEAVSHAVALRAGDHRCGHGLEAQLLGKALGLAGHVAATVVCQPFNVLG